MLGAVPRASDFPDFRRCTYCTELVPEDQRIEWEHVFPESYYSAEPLPPGFEKPQVPSCGPCNAAFAAIEERVRLRWGAALPADGTPGRKGIFEGVVQSIRPIPVPPGGASRRRIRSNDAKQRAARAMQKALTIVSTSEFGTGKVLGTPDTKPLLLKNRGLFAVGHPGIEIDPADYLALGRKLVRGFTRYEWKKMLDKGQTIEVRVLMTDSEKQQMVGLMTGGTLPVERRVIGSGSLEYAVAGPPYYVAPSIWCFILWRHYWLLARVLSPVGS